MMNYLSQFYPTETLKQIHESSVDALIELYSRMQPITTTIGELADYKGELFTDSPDGLVKVKSLVKKKDHQIIEITMESGKKIKTSPFHMFQSPNGAFIATANLQVGTGILAVGDVVDVVKEIKDLGYIDDVYDLSVLHENHRYYTCGLSSHNSGAGKSLFLQNQAINWVMQGKNIVYITLELSEKLCASRIDAMTTGIATWEVLKDIDKTAIQVVNFYKKYKGTLQLKQLKGGCNSNDLRSFIKELEIKTGKKIDGIAVDYLDLMMPNSAKINVSDQFIKDKFVSEELRNLAVELDILLVTASQLNRSSYEEVDFNPSNIAGGISKLNTADNLIGIFTSATMKEAGRYQLQFMKTRSSAGVGSKVELKFNPATLRIEDMTEVEASNMRQNSASVIDAIRRKDSAQQEKVTQETIETASKAVNQVNSIRDLLSKVQKR